MFEASTSVAVAPLPARRKPALASVSATSVCVRLSTAKQRGRQSASRTLRMETAASVGPTRSGTREAIHDPDGIVTREWRFTSFPSGPAATSCMRDGPRPRPAAARRGHRLQAAVGRPLHDDALDNRTRARAPREARRARPGIELDRAPSGASRPVDGGEGRRTAPAVAPALGAPRARVLSGGPCRRAGDADHPRCAAERLGPASLVAGLEQPWRRAVAGARALPGAERHRPLLFVPHRRPPARRPGRQARPRRGTLGAGAKRGAGAARRRGGAPVPGARTARRRGRAYRSGCRACSGSSSAPRSGLRDILHGL